MSTIKILVAIIIASILKFDVIICSTDHWPLGTYTMPKPKSGCPHTAKHTWQEAWRYQDLENDAQQGSKFSSNFHMDAKIINNDIIRGFCTSFNKDVQEPWPEGSYCIYRNSNYCPPNMTQGFIDWYDEQNNNQNEFHRYLTLPDGIYFGPSTRVLYCCHTTGKWYKSIELPTEKPFYLLPYGTGNCQRVMGAVSSLEYIIYDTEDEYNWDEFDGHHVFTDKLKSLPKVFYCYYEGCQYKLRNHSGSFTSPNFRNNSYPDFQFCSWSITVNVSLRISLKFQTLNIPNCEENYLDIYDGSSAIGSTLLARFCGENATSGARVKSRTNNLFIVFKSGNNSIESMEDLSKILQFHLEYEAFYTATPVTTTTMVTTTKITPTASTGKSLNNAYLSTVTSSTTTSSIPKIRGPGAAKEILTKNYAFLSTPTSLATTGISTINTYENRKMGSQNSNNDSSAIYLLISLPILAILILLVVVGTIFYWRRHKKKDAATINDRSGTIGKTRV